MNYFNQLAILNKFYIYVFVYKEENNIKDTFVVVEKNTYNNYIFNPSILAN